MQITLNGHSSIEIEKEGDLLFLNKEIVQPDVKWQSNGQASILLNNKSYIAQIEKLDKDNKEIVLKVNGQRFTLNIKEDIDILLEKMGINMSASQKATPLKAPMPGMILKILVEAGQQVQKGDALLILEAMKMENVLKAAGPAIIKTIKAIEKTAVEKGAILIEME